MLVFVEDKDTTRRPVWAALLAVREESGDEAVLTTLCGSGIHA